MGEKLKVLITVKTYPLPSGKYDELVCTAGVLENGSFIRLYPIDYRYRAYDEWYAKYQWVEVEVEKNEKDYRLESYRPIGEIKPLEIIGTENNWAERKKYVLAKYGPTMCDLQNKKLCKKVSLGIIKPRVVEDFIIKETEREWKTEWLEKMRQLNFFHERKPLEKIPYKFIYKFKCSHSNCNGHCMMIEDWEVGELYRKMRDKYKDEKIACEKVKQRFYNNICGKDKDTYFFVGTTMPYGTWIIIGTFYPKKQSEQLKFL
jgi:hypothetical protein